MNQRPDEFKTSMSAVRERIAAAKRHGTNRRFIDYYGCIYVTNELIEIMEEASESAEHGRFTYAYSVAALVLINLAKLAGSADDSAGGITDVKGYVEAVLEKICSGVEYNTADAEFIYLQAIKDSQNKAFDGWDEFAYILLQPVAQLSTPGNVGKLYATLDVLSMKLSQKEYTSWHLECDCLVRLAAITSVEGEEAAGKLINDNLRYDGVRRIGIQKAIDLCDYARAEKLCLDKIMTANRDYNWTNEWYDKLFEIYVQTDQKDRQISLAEDLLVNKHDTKYYEILKQLLSEKNMWQTEYPSLLERLSKKLPYNQYQGILSKEGETRLLLAEVSRHTASVFHYGKQLFAEFPQETFALCLEEIRKQAAEADNRVKYKRVCCAIDMLNGFGGVAESVSIINEMKAKYPRRPSMIEELSTLAVKLAKKKKSGRLIT